MTARNAHVNSHTAKRCLSLDTAFLPAIFAGDSRFRRRFRVSSSLGMNDQNNGARDRRRWIYRAQSRALSRRAGATGVIAASRTASNYRDPNIVLAPLPDLSLPFDWQPLLQECSAVVHLAGIAHTYASEPLYDRVNRQATEALAHAAFRAGAHLVFVSSIAAQSGSFSDSELTEDDPPRPDNAYGRSKLAAEKGVRAAGVSFTILRPVVIYGDGEKGNFATVHKISRLPLPLPFGALTARRSVLSVQNSAPRS